MFCRNASLRRLRREEDLRLNEPNVNYELLDGIIERNGCAGSSVIAVLQNVQEHYRYLPREVFPHLAKRLGVSQARLYSIATFYENFSLSPKGEYVIRICDGTACHVRKSTPFP
ncbi:MAG: NAD(P)H-dependent oxidoreductase subunit E [Clostridiales Family XIII bacterium]|jgi:NADH-quinone oxidoreductase subunit E|nr:NAD(P)H-dependent oxidoreductase subunit E [Clostridiales Family XIII bacterium]